DVGSRLVTNGDDVVEAADANLVNEAVLYGVGRQVEPVKQLALVAQRVDGSVGARVLVLRPVGVVVQAGEDQGPRAVATAGLGAGVRRSVKHAGASRNHDQPMKVALSLIRSHM